MNTSPLTNTRKHLTLADLVVAFAIGICTILAMLARRPDQWISPTLWVEDKKILIAFAQDGWTSIFYPVNGYLILPSKLILCMSAAISFRWLPEISFGLALIFTVAVLLCVAFCPTTLKHRVYCTLMILALPVNPEVYGTSEYSFWWGSLLAILPFFWDENARDRGLLRLTLLLVGGLSSPLVVALAPMYLACAVLARTRSSWTDFGVAALAAGAQCTAVFITGEVPPPPSANFNALFFIRDFFGYFIYAPVQGGNYEFIAAGLGLLLIAVLVGIWIIHRNDINESSKRTILKLLLLVILSGVLAGTRVPLGAIHPWSDGPRYFFLPFTFLSWLLLQVFAFGTRIAQITVAIVLALAMRTALDIGQRRHDKLDWRSSVEKCLVSEEYDLPVHYNGVANRAWNAPLLGAQCRRMVEMSWFDNQIRAL